MEGFPAKAGQPWQASPEQMEVSPHLYSSSSPLLTYVVWFLGELLWDADQPEPEAQQQQRFWFPGSLGLNRSLCHIYPAR